MIAKKTTPKWKREKKDLLKFPFIGSLWMQFIIVQRNCENRTHYGHRAHHKCMNVGAGFV